MRRPSIPRQERGNPRQLPQKRSLPPVREPPSSFESFVRLDKSAVLFLIFCFCLIHWLIRVFIAPVYTIEEADQLLLSQALKVGYEAREPPLLTWLHALAIRGGGLNQWVVFGVKYVLLFIGLTFYYLAARNVLIRPGVSAAAVAAWALTFQVGWNMHEDLLNAVGLMAALSLTLHALTRILTWRRYRDWVYLGVTLGIGLLMHHLFIVFPLAMLIGVLISPFFRDAVTLPRLGIMALVAALIYGPYAYWVLTHIGSVVDAARSYAASWEIDSGWLQRAENGAVAFGRTLLEFTLPLSLFWLMLFWPMWLPVIYPVFQRRSTDEEPHETAWRRLLARATLFGAIVFLLGVLFGVQTYKGYWMLPVMFGVPIWMFAHVKRAGDFPVAIRGFAAVVIAFAVLVIAGRFVEWRLEVRMCDDCRPYAPITAWADELKNSGFEYGTIVGADKHLTGNLRAAFPKARVLDASIAPDAFPPPATNGACLAVWREETDMPGDLTAYLSEDLLTTPTGPNPEGAIRRNLRLSDTKAATLYLQFLPSSDSCR
ncbi:MAG TPA: glycosyltransferase family 39 protein [Hyphomonadaceae bacterium]|nr:glycosyltransferase family 39 protein [Hyphomonadaceae bacterium]